MVEFKRQKRESFESFLRRFNKRLQQTGKLFHARQIRYLRSKDTKAKQKKSALVGKKYREKKEYLRKVGKLEEEPRRRW